MTKETSVFDDKNFGEDSEVKALNIDWGRVGDFILGTFVKARHNIETQFGVNSIYEILAEKGQYHALIKKKPADTPTEAQKGTVYSIWGRNDIFNGMLNSMKPGQIVKLMFVESRETKMGDAKVIKVFAPKDNEGKSLMNEEWIQAQGISGIDM